MALSAAGYQSLRELIRSRSGMVLDESKNYLIDARLDPVARREGFENLEKLVAAVLRGAGAELVDRVVQSMMVHETSFFRDLHPFETLRAQVIPELMKARQGTRRLRIWCAASSSGQEPYSIAMTLAHHFAELLRWDLQIHVSDLSERMLERTERGRYSRLEVNRGLPGTMLSQFFCEDGAEWVVRDDLRSLMKVHRINLIEPWPALPAMDVVFLRNVLIYFDVGEKRSILERVAALLQPDGALFLGAAETTLQIASQFEALRSGTGLYYRPKG